MSVWGGVGLVRRGTTVCVTVCVLAGIAVALLGCGSSAQDTTVVQVGNYTLSKAAIAHWTPIEAIVSLELIPKGPIAKGMVPDPPNYTNCITFQRNLAAHAPGTHHIPPPAQLKRECQTRYETVRTHILNILINYGWMTEEAAKHGIKLTDNEVKKRLEKGIRTEFPSKTAFHEYLKHTGLTEADELLRYRGAMISGLLYTKVFLHQPHPQTAYPEYLLKWTAKTHCAPGYITPNCKEYKGPLPPGN